MKAKLTSQTASESLGVAVTGGGTMELIAVIAAMILVACGAAALLLMTPSPLQSAANAAATDRAQMAPASERSFNERDPVNVVRDTIDTSTF